MSLVDVVAVAVRGAGSARAGGPPNGSHPVNRAPSMDEGMITCHALGIAVARVMQFLSDPVISASVERIVRDWTANPTDDDGGRDRDTEGYPHRDLSAALVQRISKLYVRVLLCNRTVVPPTSAYGCNQDCAKFLQHEAVTSSVILTEELCCLLEDDFMRPYAGSAPREGTRRALGDIMTSMSPALVWQLFLGQRPVTLVGAPTGGEPNRRMHTSWDRHVDATAMASLEAGVGFCGLWPTWHLHDVLLWSSCASTCCLGSAVPVSCFLPLALPHSAGGELCGHHMPNAPSLAHPTSTAAADFVLSLSEPWRMCVMRITQTERSAPYSHLAMEDDDRGGSSRTEAEKASFEGSLVEPLRCCVDGDEALHEEEHHRCQYDVYEHLRTNTLLPATAVRLLHLAARPGNHRESALAAAAARDALCCLLYYHVAHPSSDPNVDDDCGGRQLAQHVAAASEIVQYVLQRPDVLSAGCPEVLLQTLEQSLDDHQTAVHSTTSAVSFAAAALRSDAAQILLLTRTAMTTLLPSPDFARASFLCEEETTRGAPPFGGGPSWEGFACSHIGDAPCTAGSSSDDCSLETRSDGVMRPPEPLKSTIVAHPNEGKIVRLKLKVAQGPPGGETAPRPQQDAPSASSLRATTLATQSVEWRLAVAEFVRVLSHESASVAASLRELFAGVDGAAQRWNVIALPRVGKIISLGRSEAAPPPCFVMLSKWAGPPPATAPKDIADDSTFSHNSSATASVMGLVILKYVALLAAQYPPRGDAADMPHPPLRATSTGVSMLVRVLRHCPGSFVRLRGLCCLGDVLRHMACMESQRGTHSLMVPLLQHVIDWLDGP